MYFFAPWSNFLFGYRDGQHKLIVDETNNTAEIYDLRNDPRETVNLAPRLPAAVSTGRARLAACVQYQNRFLKDLLLEQAK